MGKISDFQNRKNVGQIHIPAQVKNFGNFIKNFRKLSVQLKKILERLKKIPEISGENVRFYVLKKINSNF